MSIKYIILCLFVFVMGFSIATYSSVHAEEDKKPGITLSLQKMGVVNGYEVHAIIYDNNSTPAKIDSVCTTLTKPAFGNEDESVGISCTSFDPEWGR
jgi:nitrogen fixation protein FixH